MADSLEVWDAKYDPFATMDASAVPVQEQLLKFTEFIRENRATLRDVEEAICESIIDTRETSTQPILLHLQPPEKVDIPDLITTDNELFNKVTTVFAVLCDEITELSLVAEQTFYSPLLLFGCAEEEDGFQEGEGELQIGRMLSTFQDLSNFVDRCNSITVNVVHQLASLYHARQKLYQSTFRHVHMSPVFDALAELLRVLVTLDSLVAHNSGITIAWEEYKKMMQYVRAEPARYGADDAKLRHFERLLVSLDSSVMAGGMFATCIDQNFEVAPLDSDAQDAVLVDVRNNKMFLAEMKFCVKAALERCIAGIGSPTESDQRQRFVGVAALYSLYRRLLPRGAKPDQKMFLQFWEVQKKCPMVPLCGRVPWLLAEFLTTYAPLPVKRRYLNPRDPFQHRRDMVRTLDSALQGQVHAFSLRVSTWLLWVEHHLHPLHTLQAPLPPQLRERGHLILSGMLIGYAIQNTLHHFIVMHVSLGAPMHKDNVFAICKCVEMLKAIEGCYARYQAIIAKTATLVTRQLTSALESIFRPLKNRLASSSRLDDTKLDMLAAATVAEGVFQGCESVSVTRLTVASLALRVVLMKGMVRDSDAQDVLQQLRQLELLGTWQRRVRSVCDCSFLYWSRELLPSFIQHVYSLPEQAYRLHYIIAAFRDARALLVAAEHQAPLPVDNSAVAAELSDPAVLVEYEAFLQDCLVENLADPLSRDVERYLRLQIHAVHLDHMQTPNPKQNNAQGLAAFLNLPPFTLFHSRMDVKEAVTQYLCREFYELTVLALHDWGTYAEMRHLARENFGLHIADSYLPMGTLHTGLDVLQIMRNVHVFVSMYNYNANTQTFIERRPDKGAKHLNTISIHSIANSIRTHGTGMLNTTVNFTYQFLARKFAVFSEFLFDTYIKSYLMREQRWFKKNKADLENRYAYDHAMSFNKEIRKLGQTQDGSSFLDQFRRLITEIGNALGYVRMVRSAAIHYSSSAVSFVPDLTSMISFKEHAGTGADAANAATIGGADDEQKEPSPADGDGDGDGDGDASSPSGVAVSGAGLGEATVSAAGNLDALLSCLRKNFSEGIDYFQVLVGVFQEVLLTPDHSHLETFHMIVPALIINHVEATRLAKERILKAHKSGGMGSSRGVASSAVNAYFTDDGFSLGVAFILSILKQGSQFDSLHWFESTNGHFTQDKKELTSRRRAARKDGEVLQELELKAKRIATYQREFELLFFSLSGARIFFANES